MELAISNIAWLENEDEEIYELMRRYDFKGLEIAPSRIFDNPYNESVKNIKKFRDKINKKGFKIVAMQALLYGHPELKIFETDEVKKRTLNYLKDCIKFASKLGAKVLVFGSPKNRNIGKMNKNKAMGVAINFFSILGNFALQNNVIFCIEPNPIEYNTDFINTTKEGLEFVKIVNNNGFRLHIDTGTIIINNEPYDEIIEYAFKYIAHLHISEPYLNMISRKNYLIHSEVANILRNLGYDKWVSIEMRNGLRESNVEVVKMALKLVNQIYKK